MTQSSTTQAFDKQIRRYIYEHIVTTGQTPTIAQCAQNFSSSVAKVHEAFQRLASDHALMLQNNGEILMAQPFSAVPTDFYVEVGSRGWWGNCIWDALGIPAMLKKDARVMTSCGDCSNAMIVEVKHGSLIDTSGVVHYAVPARDWWKDIAFT
jgi:hypothetical protein